METRTTREQRDGIIGGPFKADKQYVRELAQDCNELEDLLHKVLPHIPASAIDGKKAETHKVSECYLVDMVTAALKASAEKRP